MSNNPFSGPFAPSEDIIANPEGISGIGCPICHKKDYDAYSTEFTIVRTCRACGNQWTGGSFVGIPDYSQMPPPSGVAPPEDYPVSQFTGASFRDPSKNFDGDFY